MNVLPVHMYVYYTMAWYRQRLEQAVGALEVEL